MVNSKVVRLILEPAFNPMTLGWEHIYWAEQRNGSPQRGNRHATRRATRDRKTRLALRCNRCSSLRLQKTVQCRALRNTATQARTYPTLEASHHRKNKTKARRADTDCAQEGILCSGGGVRERAEASKRHPGLLCRHRPWRDQPCNNCIEQAGFCTAYYRWLSS